MSNEVKRWTFEQVFGKAIQSDELRGPWIEAKDHDRIVAEKDAEIRVLKEASEILRNREWAAENEDELKAQLEHSETKVDWLLRDNERVAKEKDDAYNMLNNINIALHERLANQQKVIARLKTYVQHRADCICRSGVLQYSDDCDCGLAAIERGEGLE